MKRNTLITTLGLAATIGATALLPTMASANLQQDKNNMRNLAIAGAAIAGYGLLNHNTGATLLGAAGAALAGSQYEKDRKQQSQWNNRWYGGRDYYRGGNGNWGDRWNNGGRNYDNRGYNDNRDYRNYNDNQDNRNYNDNRDYRNYNDNRDYRGDRDDHRDRGRGHGDD